MKGDVYSAKEAMKKLGIPTTTFYRKVKEGHIPYTGQRPMRFPKEAIDAIAEVDLEDEKDDKLLFRVAPRGGLWKMREIIKEAYGIEDPIPYKTVLEWQKRNEEIFMQVNKGDAILGWTTFLPMGEEIITALIEDKMREEDIPPDAVKTWDEPQLSVYIANLEVVETEDRTSDKVVAAFLIRGTIKWALTLIEQYDIKNWYGIGADRASQAMLEAPGFKQIVSMDRGRRKGYKLDDLTKPSRLLKRFLRKH